MAASPSRCSALRKEDGSDGVGAGAGAGEFIGLADLKGGGCCVSFVGCEDGADNSFLHVIFSGIEEGVGGLLVGDVDWISWRLCVSMIVIAIDVFTISDSAQVSFSSF